MNKVDLKSKRSAMKGAIKGFVGMFAAFLLLTGCGAGRVASGGELQTQEYRPDENSALIHVYRPGSMVGMAISYNLHLDDEVVFRVKNKSKTTVRVTGAGSKTLWARTETREELPIDIEPGKEYYVRCGLEIGALVGRPKLEIVDEQVGKLEFGKIKNYVPAPTVGTFSQATSQPVVSQQQETQGVSQPVEIQKDASKGFYLGLGTGLDYGGIGVKAEFDPVKHIGLSAGAGYNYMGLGWSLGGTYRILPDAQICPVINALYGNNGVLVVEGAEHYNATSYGVSFGGGIEWSFGSKGHKINLNLLIPLRSSSFMDNYDAVKNNSSIQIENDLSPVVFSVGFNFRIF